MIIRLIATVTLLTSSAALAAPLNASPALSVGTFTQQIGGAFGHDAGITELDIRSIAVMPDNTVFAGTTRGLVQRSGDVFTPVAGLESAEILALAAHGDSLLIATPSHVYIRTGDTLEAWMEALPARPTSIAWDTDHIVLGSVHGFFTVTKGNVAPEETLHAFMGETRRVFGVAARDSRVSVASQTGLYERAPGGTWAPVFPWEAAERWSPVDVRAVAYDAEGRLWFAAPQGVGCRQTAGEWNLYTGADGLPYNDFTAIAAGPGGAIWLGTRFGAIHFDGSEWAYREGRRWLPDNEVRAIALDPAGNAWFATGAGVGLIEQRPMTFAEKAAYYEDEIDRYHRRTPYGYVWNARLAEPGDKSTASQYDSDNDGQYTGLYGAAEAFAYAATRDPKAKERATKAFEALAFLSEVAQGGEHPAPPGFIARTILPTSGPNPNEHDSPDRDRKKQETDKLWKVIEPRWPTSADGQWYWKSDTSSDELDGHFFLYGLYYDLVAETDAEKARAREVTGRVADHLLEHDFRLVDHDGRPTRWAHFSPKDLNDDPNWWTERGLNSMSILTYLSIAHHVTGDAKYRAAFEDLAWNHHYALNAMTMPKLQAGPGSFVQFDEEMAFMNYYHLLGYETDPALLRMFQNSIYYYWQLERYELNPFLNFVYASRCLHQTMTTQWGATDLSPTGPWLAQSVDTLKRFPWDLVDWRHTNSKRIDIVPLPDHAREPGEAEGKGFRTNGYVIPIDERQTLGTSDDVWELDTGGDGHGMVNGYPYLLAYYMGLYHGFVK